MVKEIKFKHFNIYCFKNVKDSDVKSIYDKFITRDDLFVCLSKATFIERIKNISSEKLFYLNYWKENARKQMIDIYEEIIENYSKIEYETIDSDYDVYLVRKKDAKINYLKEGHLDIEFSKIMTDINIAIEVKILSFSEKFDTKLKQLETRLNKAATYNFFTYDNFLINPNLKLSGNKYQSKP
jgi:hypothetical protein